MTGGPPPTALSLDELAQLAEKATPGPWTVSHGDRLTVEHRPMFVCEVGDHDARGAADDAAFIAAADPSVVAALVNVAKQLISHVGRTHDGFGDPPCSCTPCREARAALAVLDACLSGAQPNSKEGES